MPLFDIFWSMLFFFLFFAWIWMLISVFGDVLRSRDLSGAMKAFWAIFILVIPWLGVISYLIVRGDSMSERAVATYQEREAATQDYIRQAAGSTSTADELAKLADLKTSGVLSDAEFQAQKAKLLA